MPPPMPSPLTLALRALQPGETLIWPSTNPKQDQASALTCFRVWADPSTKLTTSADTTTGTVTFTKFRASDPKPPKPPKPWLRPVITIPYGETLLWPATDNPKREVNRLHKALHHWRSLGGRERSRDFSFTIHLPTPFQTYILITRAPYE